MRAFPMVTTVFTIGFTSAVAMATEAVGVPQSSDPVAAEEQGIDQDSSPEETEADSEQEHNAETSQPTPPPFLRLHAGLNLRTDLGVHPLRLDMGGQFSEFDLVLVLDPMFWTDKQSNTDLLVQWRNSSGISPIVGWRLTTISLQGGLQLQQNLVLAAAADLPKLWDGHISGQAGLELATVVLKHGADLPPELISFASARHYLDLVNFALFLRLEYNLEL